jgi:hypothetical protein
MDQLFYLATRNQDVRLFIEMAAVVADFLKIDIESGNLNENCDIETYSDFAEKYKSLDQQFSTYLVSTDIVRNNPFDLTIDWSTATLSEKNIWLCAVLRSMHDEEAKYKMRIQELELELAYKNQRIADLEIFADQNESNTYRKEKALIKNQRSMIHVLEKTVFKLREKLYDGPTK